MVDSVVEQSPRRLVFTDLDGSLLDHHSYSYEPAQPQLEALEQAAIPVLPATSKTRAEIENLRLELANQHPFIVENGAAVFIPRDYFEQQPSFTRLAGDYWIYELVSGRARWQELLAARVGAYPGEFETFADAGAEGIMAMTGLTEQAALRANQRDYSEPVQWRGSAERQAEFIADLVSAGASVTRGGRFLSVSGDCDKGRALTWLSAEYARQWGVATIETLAIGDSDNDCAMLDAAGTALLIRSPAHGFPALNRTTGIIRSTHSGPAGWAEGVAQWLAGNVQQQN